MLRYLPRPALSWWPAMAEKQIRKREFQLPKALK
jgi:hypothetical protein